MIVSASVSRRLLMAGGLAAMAAGMAATPASAAAAMTLFKVISQRDEIFVGIPATDLAALGSGPQAELISRKIAADGQMSLWRYSVQRGADGTLVMAPMGKVGVFAAGLVRIEPFTPAHPVVAPQP
ncbi:MAG: hypothetical protein J0H01_00170 [Rhizobiales bacterium]|nr:hypothetical protein [Hyphomicrobiales bacterium]